LIKTNHATIHNFHKAEELKNGEEGVNYLNQKPNEVDPNKINEKKLEREIKAKLRKMKEEGEPELAEEFEKFIFSTDTEIDRAMA
jgi:DNA replication protein DnaC